MGIYLAAFRFEDAAPSWDVLFARVRMRHPKPDRCRIETRPEPGRREYALLSSGPREGIDLQRRDGNTISYSHGPAPFPLGMALRRALIDLGGADESETLVRLASGRPPTTAEIARRFAEKTKRNIEAGDVRAHDPPLETHDGPLLAEARLQVNGKTPSTFDVRVHLRTVTLRHYGQTSPFREELLAALAELGCSPL